MAADTKTPRAGKFGKLSPRHDRRTLMLSRYLLPDLPPAPEHFNALPRAESGAKQPDPTRLFPILGNNRYGDCTIAAAAHAETLWNAYMGKRRIPTTKAVLNDYFALTGGPDSGLVMLDVCNHWRQSGITGERILAFVGVDRRRHDMVRQAIYLFGGVYLGFSVQRDAISDFEARRMWTPGPETGSGHCVWAYAYTPDWLAVLTWGSTCRASWDWFDQMADESFAILPGEGTIPNFAPGIDYAALKSDLQAVSG